MSMVERSKKGESISSLDRENRKSVFLYSGKYVDFCGTNRGESQAFSGKLETASNGAGPTARRKGIVL